MSRKSSSKSSVLYAIISNTIVLVLIGLFLLLYFHTNAITSILKERINIIVELKDGMTSQSVSLLQTELSQKNEIIPGSIKYVPSSKAGDILGHEIDMDLLGSESPFKNVILFNVKKEFYNDKSLLDLKKNISANSEVSDVIYENLMIENVKSNLKKLSLGIFILNLFFLVLVIVIMYNTINLSLYADRWEIKTMEIIGARDSFIRQPYVKIAGRIALTSFVISSIIILFLLGLGYFNSDFIQQVTQPLFVILALGIIFVLSLAITIIATISIVNNYLYQEEEDLYQ